ncbi:MAG: DUF2085 domain-containing protein [Anaerolineae bacterium]|nr:DUF2085 domain-containing protein [Anaerolineae bacterium]
MKSDKATASRADRLMYWFAGHWLQVVLFIIFVYVSLPFAAPVLMKLGAEGPARVVYTLYRPLCHQLAFRSGFLFGAQLAYPLEQAGMQDIGSFQSYVVDEPAFRELFARYHNEFTGEVWTADMVDAEALAPISLALQYAAHEFTGSPAMGYKIALCERDVAIYGAILLGGLLFALVRERLRPVPLLLYLFLGIGPIALDGGSQLLGTPPVSLWPVRETYPMLRVVTGALFGLMNVWLAFPYLEQAMRETREEIGARLAHATARASERDAARATLETYMSNLQDKIDEPRSDA